MGNGSDFDWTDSETVLFKSIQGIAVYTNPDGDVVIRQERDVYKDDDDFVVIPIIYLDDLISRLQNMRDDILEDKPMGSPGLKIVGNDAEDL